MSLDSTSGIYIFNIFPQCFRSALLYLANNREISGILSNIISIVGGLHLIHWQSGLHLYIKFFLFLDSWGNPFAKAGRCIISIKIEEVRPQKVKRKKRHCKQTVWH